jgi:hypothetical protein
MRDRFLNIVIAFAIVLAFPQASGAQWEKVSSPKGLRLNSIVAKGEVLFVTVEEGGVFLSTDNGGTWKAVNSGLPPKAICRRIAVSGANVVVSTAEHGVFLSANNGGWWKPLNAGLPDEAGVYGLAVKGSLLFAGTSAGVIHPSSSGGWSEPGKGLPEKAYICGFAVSGENIYVGCNPGGVYVSADDGAAWTPVGEGLPENVKIFCLAANGTDVFIGTEMQGVLRSSDGRDKWQPARSGILETEIHCLLFIGPDLYAGTGGGHDATFSSSGVTSLLHGAGVVLSKDKGAHWKALNSGLPRPGPQWPMMTGRIEGWIECLVVCGDFLFAGTFNGPKGCEIWRLPLAELK